MGLRALVVDDSRVMRNMVMKALSKTELTSFEFTEAENGVDALSKFNPHSIDIMFVDINMPKMNGIELVRKVRDQKDAKELPIVMITSEKTMDKVEAALDSAGADSYITKPFTVDELNKKLETLIYKAGKRADSMKKQKSSGFFSKLLK